MTPAECARRAIPFMKMSNSKKRKTRVSAALPADASPGLTSHWLDQASAFARREPTKAVVSAFGAGLLLNLLPIRVVAAIVVALARPVLLMLGMLKVWEIRPSKKEPKV